MARYAAEEEKLANEERAGTAEEGGGEATQWH